MLSYLFMKILEQRPQTYDRAMARASRGRVGELKRSTAASVPPGSHVLEIGCGTGELAQMLAAKGCQIDGFDPNPGMVAQARQRGAQLSLRKRFTVRQIGVEDMDQLPAETYDLVAATLVFSELSPEERRYALEQTYRVLLPGGRLLVGDEVRPQTRVARLLYNLTRGAMLVLSGLLSGSLTHPLEDFPAQVQAAGFVLEKEGRRPGGSLALFVARKLQDAA